MKDSNRYKKSNEFLKRAEKVIPLGSQTFSKSKLHFPEGVSPLFLSHGKGSHVWDIDGNEYIDFSNALAAVTLGYQDPDVDGAVMEQMKNGVSFSLAHPLETLVAEKIIEMVPSAEMVRFGKNGSDATAGAIRLARAYTKRDHVLVGGYHGWQDWYIGSTTRDLGVPEVVKELTHKFTYNDIDSLHALFNKYPGQVAAVILEPQYGNGPEDNFLEKVKELTHQHGAVLIFDEIVTGFRMAKGGAQEYYGVTPDLTTIGKGMGNGYPISAVVGKAEIMRLMEEIFFSFTFGGETLSLAATLATLEKLECEPVLETIAMQGKKLREGVEGLIAKHQLEDVISIGGYDAQTYLIINDHKKITQWEIKTLLLQELYSNGVLTVGVHNLSFTHEISDIDHLLDVYDSVFEKISVSETEKLISNIAGHLLKPLFNVR